MYISGNQLSNIPNNVNQNELYLMMSHQQNMKSKNSQKNKFNQSFNDGFYPHNFMGSGNLNQTLNFYDKEIQELCEEDENNVIFLLKIMQTKIFYRKNSFQSH